MNNDLLERARAKVPYIPIEGISTIMYTQTVLFFNSFCSFPRIVEKRVNDVAGRGGGRPLRHFRSSSVPLPLVMDSLVHSNIGTSIKAALQTAPHSIEEGSGGSMSSPRKQPPPKPKRDPNTRLSASYEAVSAGLSIAPKDSPADGQASPSGSPPKTQLSPSDRTYTHWISLIMGTFL